MSHIAVMSSPVLSHIHLAMKVSAMPQLRQIFAGDPPDLVFDEDQTHAIGIVAHNLGVATLQFATSIVPWDGQRE